MSKTGDLYQAMADAKVPKAKQQSWLEKHAAQHQQPKAESLGGHNANLLTYPDGSQVCRLHTTDVVKKSSSGEVTLNSGGWRTPTTKKFINRALAKMAVNAGVRQDKGEWNVNGHPFVDGMTLPHDTVRNLMGKPAKKATVKAVRVDYMPKVRSINREAGGNKSVRVKASHGKKSYIRAKARK